MWSLCYFFSYFQPFCLECRWLPFFHILSFFHQLCHFNLPCKRSFFSRRLTSSIRLRWVLLDLPEPPKTWKLFEERLSCLFNSPSFIQQWIFYLTTHMLWSASSNHPSSLSWSSKGTKELYPLWKSNITLKRSCICCIWSFKVSMFLH